MAEERQPRPAKRRAAQRGARRPPRVTDAGAPPPKSKIPRAAPITRTESPPTVARRRGSTRKGTSRTLGAAHAAEVYRRLLTLYPDAHCELDHRDAWQLLVATILSAQCTDKRVNMVTPGLFAAYPTPAALAAARHEDVEAIIRSTGFFRAKAKSIIGMAQALVARHAGQVPAAMDQLVTLPGVGRKTANVVLGNAWGINDGVVVDTHVARLARRLGLTTHEDPGRIEQDLMALVPRDRWTMLSHLLIWHGRRCCDARRPRCGACSLASICPAALPA